MAFVHAEHDPARAVGREEGGSISGGRLPQMVAVRAEISRQTLMAENLARRFHEAYEQLAPGFGYETRPETRAFSPTSPNGLLMIAVCREILREGVEHA